MKFGVKVLEIFERHTVVSSGHKKCATKQDKHQQPHNAKNGEGLAPKVRTVLLRQTLDAGPFGAGRHRRVGSPNAAEQRANN